MGLPGAWYWRRARCYEERGTELEYAATCHWGGVCCYEDRGTELEYAATWYWGGVCCYEERGTDSGHAGTRSVVEEGVSAFVARFEGRSCAISIRAPYAKPDTDLAYAATSNRWVSGESEHHMGSSTLSCYAAATQCAVLTSG
eukprot:3939446-Rhodomonas_salina.3